MFVSIQRGSMSKNFSNPLLWLYPTIPPSHGTSVSLHSLLRALESSITLTFTFLHALLNPAPKVDGASLQPAISYIIKQVLLFSLPQRRWKHTKNIYKTIWLSSKSLLSCQAWRSSAAKQQVCQNHCSSWQPPQSASFTPQAVCHVSLALNRELFNLG